MKTLFLSLTATAIIFAFTTDVNGQVRDSSVTDTSKKTEDRPLIGNGVIDTISSQTDTVDSAAYPRSPDTGIHPNEDVPDSYDSTITTPNNPDPTTPIPTTPVPDTNNPNNIPGTTDSDKDNNPSTPDTKQPDAVNDVNNPAVTP